MPFPVAYARPSTYSPALRICMPADFSQAASRRSATVRPSMHVLLKIVLGHVPQVNVTLVCHMCPHPMTSTRTRPNSSTWRTSPRLSDLLARLTNPASSASWS